MTDQRQAVVSGAIQVLAHVPGLARHGSKPARELPRHPDVEQAFLASLRSYDDAVAYAPHQAYIGATHPRDMGERPWWGKTGTASRLGPRGEIVPDVEFLGLLAAVDRFDLVVLAPDAADEAAAALAQHPLAKHLDLDRIDKAKGDAAATMLRPGSLPLHLGDGRLAGAATAAHEQDESLTAIVLLDNLASKATATLALLHLLHNEGVDPASVDFVIGCGEEAVGDRYQRGGGNMAKAVAEVAGLSEASGMDVKNFCAAPAPALVTAAAMVSAGLFDRIAVIGGGSMAKLGMKFQGHLKHQMPVMEDVLGGAAALVQVDDGLSPRIRLDSVGRHRVAAGGSNPAIMEALAVEPLRRLGIPMTDVDDYATELHNPEITEPQGSGDVAARNYKTIAALAAQAGEIERADIAGFAAEHGMPGFAPTQGHLASSLCYLPHAVDRLTTGDAGRVLLLAKGSLFLGRMSQLSDGMSVLLERNGKGG
ncbi:MAG TPA: glycine/sarcosine/betaine reductase complex component C subunit beta [Acidimicrobiales bacterium]|nr:glycine/sarcosine/betaine reductase complex component C subunit beta [Acidimicrobiales bacterium]